MPVVKNVLIWSVSERKLSDDAHYNFYCTVCFFLFRLLGGHKGFQRQCCARPEKIPQVSSLELLLLDC